MANDALLHIIYDYKKTCNKSHTDIKKVKINGSMEKIDCLKK